jgi:hypothetical protein
MWGLGTWLKCKALSSTPSKRLKNMCSFKVLLFPLSDITGNMFEEGLFLACTCFLYELPSSWFIDSRKQIAPKQQSRKASFHGMGRWAPGWLRIPQF